MHYVKYYLITFFTLLVLDYLWLGHIMKQWYSENFGALMRPEISYGYAALFYILYVVGIIYFTIAPNIHQESLSPVAISAFIFGIMCYMTYDLTNAATLTNFPLAIMIPDILWGGFVTAFSASIGFYLGRVL